MCNLLILGGTTEGRLLAEYCAEQGIKAQVSVVSGYGNQVLPESPYLQILTAPMEPEEMERLIRREEIRLVLDATHPYAVQVTEHAKRVCSLSNVNYQRVVRQSGNANQINAIGTEVISVQSAAEAAAYLCDRSGSVLLTTGTRELPAFLELPGFAERVYARVLPSVEALTLCGKMGLAGKHIIAMQGPFSVDMNVAILRQLGIEWLVTKEAGAIGGFPEKLEAAKVCRIPAIVIGRPTKENGIDLEEAKGLLRSLLCDGKGFEDQTIVLKNHKAALEKQQAVIEKRQVILAGIGMGGCGQITVGANWALKGCQVVFGAARMLEAAGSIAPEAQLRPMYKASEIFRLMEKHKEWKRVGILYSGDTGFYSGAGQMRKLLEEGERSADYEVHVYPGISTISYFAAAAGTSWENAALVSLHGREQDVVGELQRRGKAFVLLDGEHTPSSVCGLLLDCGIRRAAVTVGERLSYEEERIVRGTPKQIRSQTFDSLCAMLIELEKEKE